MSATQLVIVLAIAAAVVLLWHALLLWLASRLIPERAPDEVYRVACDDGWHIELARYKAPADAPRGLPPVIICHGIGANALSLDLAERISLPRYLRARGFDCWLLDLRGRGGSARPPAGRGPYDYAFEDHARLDAKAAIELVRKETGASRVAWVGHSMGGMTAYAYAETHGDSALQAAVAIGSPVAWHKAPPLAPVARLAPLLRIPAVYQILAARMIAPLSGYWTPGIARLILNPENMEPAIIRLGLARALANFSSRAVQQFAVWIRTGELRAADGHVFFRSLGAVRTPWLAIAGSVDRLVPRGAVEAAMDLLGSSDKRFFLAGRESGLSADYGHIDLCLGPRCAEEVFARVAGFLEAHPIVTDDTRARPTGAGVVSGTAGPV